MRHLDDMVLFSSVANAGSFTAAAERLGIPRSTISRRISELEARQDIGLLERSTRSLRLTAAGRTYLTYCEQITNIADQADTAINYHKTKVSGQLRVSASLDIGQGLITPNINVFREEFPDVALDLAYSNRRVDLISEGFDLAVRIGRLEDSSLVAKRVGKTSLKFYASKEYLLKHGYPQTIDDFDSHNLLVMNDSMPKNKITLYDGQSQVELRVEAVIKVNDFVSLEKMASNGLGIALLPCFICREESSLKTVLNEWSSLESPISVLYPSHQGSTPSLKAFVKFITEIASSKLKSL